MADAVLFQEFHVGSGPGQIFSGGMQIHLRPRKLSESVLWGKQPYSQKGNKITDARANRCKPAKSSNARIIRHRLYSSTECINKELRNMRKVLETSRYHHAYLKKMHRELQNLTVR